MSVGAMAVTRMDEWVNGGRERERDELGYFIESAGLFY